MKKTLGQRFGAALVAAILTVLTSIPALAVVSFSDVPVGHVFHSYIMDAANHQILNGYKDGTFRPDGTNVVAYGLQALYNAAKAKDPSIANTYDNVGGGTWGPAVAYYKATTGGMEYPDVNAPANRLTMCIMLYYKSKDSTNAIAATGNPTFNDCGNLSATEKTAVEWCYNNGIVSGYGDGSFRPYGSLTRGHLAKMIMNWFYRFAEMATSSTATPSGTGTATPAPSTSGTTTATPAPSATTTTTPSTTTPAPSGTSGTGTNPGANRGDTPAAPTQQSGGTSNPPAAPAVQPLTAAQAVSLAESLGLTVESFTWPNDSTLTGFRVYSAYNADGYTAYTFAVNADGSQWWTQDNASSGTMGAMTPDAFRSWLQNLASGMSNATKTEIASYYLAGYAVQQGLYAIVSNNTVTVQTSASGTSSYNITNGIVAGGLAAARSAISSAATTLGNSRAEVAARAIAAYAQSKGWNAEASVYNAGEGTWHALCTKAVVNGSTTTTTTFDIVVAVGSNGLGTWVPNGGTLAEYPLAGTLEALG